MMRSYTSSTVVRALGGLFPYWITLHPRHGLCDDELLRLLLRPSLPLCHTQHQYIYVVKLATRVVTAQYNQTVPDYRGSVAASFNWRLSVHEGLAPRHCLNLNT